MRELRWRCHRMSSENPLIPKGKVFVLCDAKNVHSMTKPGVATVRPGMDATRFYFRRGETTFDATLGGRLGPKSFNDHVGIVLAAFASSDSVNDRLEGLVLQIDCSLIGLETAQKLYGGSSNEALLCVQYGMVVDSHSTATAAAAAKDTGTVAK